MITFYKDRSTLSCRARQIWGILTGYAHRRQTITHGKLARLMGDDVGHQMPQRLSAVASYVQGEWLAGFDQHRGKGRYWRAWRGHSGRKRFAPTGADLRHRLVWY